MRTPLTLQTTLVCVDIVNSTSIVAKVGDPAWAARLNRFYLTVHDAVDHHGGTCAQHTGDGTLLLFESAYNAVRLALALRTAVPQRTGLDVRVGVHLGEVVFCDDDLTGLAIHINARIQERADIGRVLVSGAIARITDHQVRYEHKGRTTLRGVPEPLDLYEAIDTFVNGESDPGVSVSETSLGHTN